RASRRSRGGSRPTVRTGRRTPRRARRSSASRGYSTLGRQTQPPYTARAVAAPARTSGDRSVGPLRAWHAERRMLAEIQGSSRLLNRELSWLAWDARVLAIAEDAATPLLERVKFLAIFGTNLDEFFQIRVAGLQEQVEAGVQKRSADGLTAAEQLERIRTRVQELTTRAATLLGEELVPALEKEKIRVVLDPS